MKLKLDANGNVVLIDGKPVYVLDNGDEIAFDAARNMDSLKNLRKENQTHREKAESLETQLKVFEGLDAKSAREALDKLKTIDQKKLIDAGEVETVKSQMKAEYEKQLLERDDRYTKLESQYNGEKIGGEFARSKFIAEKLMIPPAMVQDSFGKNFKLESGKIVGVFADGEKIYSKANPGELASFDEALSIVVDKYPHRDSILKSDQKGGSGAPGGGSSGGGNGGNTLTRSKFDLLSPSEKREFSIKGGKVSDE